MYIDFLNRQKVEINLSNLFGGASFMAERAHEANIEEHSRIEHTAIAPGIVISEQQLINPKKFMKKDYRHHGCASGMFRAIYGSAIDEQGHLSGLQGATEVFSLTPQMDAHLQRGYYGHFAGLLCGLQETIIEIGRKPCEGKLLALDLTWKSLELINNAIKENFPDISGFEPVEDVDYFTLPQDPPENSQ